MNFQNLFELRAPLDKTQKSILEFTGLFLMLLTWQIIALVIGKNGILPSPFLPIVDAAGNARSVILCIPELISNDMLFTNAGYSIYLNFMGYIEAVAIAVPLGFLIGLSPIANGLFNRPVDALRFLPLTAVTGLFMVWFGIYSSMKIHFLAFGIIVYLIPVVAQRVFEVEDVYVQTLNTLAATKWQTIRKVFMPAVFSKLSDDIRVLTAISWTYIIIAELLNNQGGLGAIIFRTSRGGRFDKSFMILFVIILIGMIQDRLFKFGDKLKFKHKYVKQEAK